MAKKEEHCRCISLSYPRCGKNWVMYIVSKLTGYKTDSFARCLSGPTALTVTHSVADMRHVANWCKPLILILRNYKECIARHGKSYPDGKCAQGNYWSNIVYFDTYDGPKHVIYYEDLIQDPDRTIASLARFLNIDLNRVIDFMLEYDIHFRASVTKYHGSKTKGDPSKLFFHSKNKTEQELKGCDEGLRKRNNKLFDKYLGRYVT